jgi:prepilin-type N-terminal cleavage/methylation domain-containing protein
MRLGSWAERSLTSRPPSFAGRRRSARGFTLVEVLVVMAIMVIVFGLLFAPMITGLSLVSRGRRHVALQDAVRLALEQVKRDLADAVYVFDPDRYPVVSIDGSAATTTLIDYSTVTVAPASRDANGNLVTPVGPALVDGGGFKAIRFTVHKVDPAAALSSYNPFVLFRQEGAVVWNGVNWVWSGTVDAENALTPRADCDLAPTVSECSACGNAWNGYAAKCLNAACANYDSAATMHYITDAAQFVPERITGEVLASAASGSIYKAKWGGWLGTQNNDTTMYPGGALPLADAGELEPRITVYRLLATGLTAYLDTFSGTSLDPQLQMRWRSGCGEVRFGDWHSNGAIYAMAPVEGPVTVGIGPSPTPDVYDSAGSLTGKTNYENDIYPVYPPGPPPADDLSAPVIPVSFVIDPSRHGAVRAAKILPDTVSVRLIIYPAGGTPYYQPLQQVFTYDQDKIGPLQFCALPSPDGRTLQVRFSRNDPPGPDRYGGAAALMAFGIEIGYYSRCNFSPSPPGTVGVVDPDDLVYVDYSTRYILNVALTLASYVDLEPSPANSSVFNLPTDARVHAVQGRDQVVVRNAMQ